MRRLAMLNWNPPSHDHGECGVATCSRFSLKWGVSQNLFGRKFTGLNKEQAERGLFILVPRV
jgi:hypothetical protein